MNKCKKLGNRATQREIAENHRARMEMRDVKNDYNRKAVAPQYAFANLSVNHPDYAMTPSEHEASKNNS